MDGKQRVWLGGNLGTLLRSDDGAASFAIAAKLPSGVKGLWFSDDGRMVACAGGVISSSEDEGATWTKTSARGGNNDHIRHARGALVATNIGRKVLRSTDGGRKWTTHPTGSKKHLYSIDADDRGTIAAGSEGSVVISRNSGASFTITKLDHREYLRVTRILPSGDVLVLGDDGKGHLVDSRGLVKPCELPAGLSVFDVCARGDELIAVGNIEHSTAARSFDGGLTWKGEAVAGRGGLKVVTALDDGTIVAAGSLGLVFVERPA